MLYKQPPSKDLLRYAQSLYERRNKAVLVPRADHSVIAALESEANRCHDNVTRWVDQHPGHKAVRGWYYFDLHEIAPFVRFVGHSVIAVEDGTFLDVTPAPLSSVYPFLTANLPDDEFHAIIEKLFNHFGVAQLDHLLN